jgi:hypothetical protein
MPSLGITSTLSLEEYPGRQADWSIVPVTPSSGPTRESSRISSGPSDHDDT